MKISIKGDLYVYCTVCRYRTEYAANVSLLHEYVERDGGKLGFIYLGDTDCPKCHNKTLTIGGDSL